jgi:ribosomal protein L37AE/L43A
MILPDGTFMPYDQFEKIYEEAQVTEITCSHCKRMTNTEPLGDDYWLCYECGTVYKN